MAIGSRRTGREKRNTFSMGTFALFLRNLEELVLSEILGRTAVTVALQSALSICAELVYVFLDDGKVGETCLRCLPWSISCGIQPRMSSLNNWSRACLISPLIISISCCVQSLI